MDTNNIVTNVKNLAKFAKIRTDIASPKLLFGAGVVLIGAGVISACKATLKVDDILDETKEKVEGENILFERGKKSEKDHKKDLTIIYLKQSCKVLKQYTLALLFLEAGIVSMGYSNHILNKRNVELLAAYQSLSDGFDKYRGRVISELGKEADHKFNYGLDDEDEIEVKETNEKGKTKKKKVKNAPILRDPLLDGCSPYAVLFAPWTTDAYSMADCYNEQFIKVAERIANDEMQVRPGKWYLYSEILNSLGIDPTFTIGRSGKSSLEVGWVDGYGDGYIDLHALRVYTKDENGDMIPVWIIDPNVDGYILDKIAGINQSEKEIRILEDNMEFQFASRMQRD